MTATPRAVSSTPRLITARAPRAVAPRSLRLRQLSGVNVRPFGTISLFLSATLILGMTSLLYLWQDAQATELGLKMPQLQADYNIAQSQYYALKQKADELQTPGRVVGLATRTYGMVPVDPSAQRVINLPPVVKVRAVYVAAAPRQAHVAAPVRLTPTNTTIASWWQGAWSVLYHVMR